MATRIPAYRQAQMEIKRYIEAQKLGLGDPLPPESVLAEKLGISRPSLREGVKALESLGIVEARHGEGVFVSAFSFDTIIENLPYSIVADGKKLVDLLQVRAALEIGVLDQVADQIGDEDKKRLRDIATRMLEAAQRNEQFDQEDGEFHSTLFRCLNNAFLSRLVDLFWQVFRRMNKASDFDSEQWSLESTAKDHLHIVEMIERGDKAGLIKAHQKHFHGIFTRMKQAQGRTDVSASPAPQVQIAPISTMNLTGRLDGLGKA
nr:FadR/GntR family transcriptional regulator [uncultured Roseateles sp.]